MRSAQVPARTFTTLVIFIGLAVLLSGLSQWQSDNPGRYLVYFLLAVLSSGWKVSLPVFPGTMSISYVFVLIGVMDFSLAETLLMGCTAIAVQSFLDPRERKGAVPLLFDVSNLAIAIGVANFVYHASWPATPGPVSLWPILPVAIVLFAMNTFPAAAFAAFNQRKSVGAMWHECSYWTLPHYVAGALIATAVCALSRLADWRTATAIVPLVYFAFRSSNQYLERIKAETSDAEDWASLHMRTLEALGLAIGARHHAEHDDLLRTRIYAQEIGKQLGLSHVEMEALRVASLLHDIGVLAVPEQIISKRGRLTREEFEKVKSHPIVGAEILQRAKFPFPVVPIVRSHHEKWNGEGYPDGLKGKEIPVGARILAVVDCLRALTSDRPYRKAVPLKQALSFIASQAGVSFDPRVVSILQEHHQEYEILVQLQSAGEAKKLRAQKRTGTAPTVPQAAPVAPAPASQLLGLDFVSSISKARREAQEVFELARNLGDSLSLNETLSAFCSRLKRTVPFDCAVVYILRENRLIPEYLSDTDYPLFLSLEIPAGDGVSGWVAKNSKPLLNADPAMEFLPSKDSGKATRLRTALSVPLPGAEGTVGVLTLYGQDREGFCKDDLRILLSVRHKLALAVENALKYRSAADSATTDHLTGLPNPRSLFHHLDGELARCRRAGTPLTVMVCDLDGFKDVNDQFGHMTGNDVLRAVSSALRRNCREYDYVARMGGDEFVMVLPGLPSQAVEARKSYLRLAVVEAAQEACPESQVTLSVGQARYPEHGHDTEELLAQADQDMYKEKQRKRLSVPARGYDFDWIGTSIQ